MEREWQSTGHDSSKSAFSVRLLHWNVLAQRLCDDWEKVDPECLTWEYRKSLFRQEFEKKGSDQGLFWDIICLAECDQHAELFSDSTQWVGEYRKKNSPTGGSAIYANAEKFSFVKLYGENYKDGEGKNET